MPVMRRRFATLVESTPAAPTPPSFNARLVGLAIKVVRRPGWEAFYGYVPVIAPRVTVPPQVHSSTFQPQRIFRSSFIIPGNEPWNAKAPNDGRWFRAFRPITIAASAGGSVQRPVPRFPYVWGWPNPNTQPATQPIVSSSR
jgi:hypothetical protein